MYEMLGGHTSSTYMRCGTSAALAQACAILWGLHPVSAACGWEGVQYDVVQCSTGQVSETHEADRIPSSAFRLVCVKG